MSHLKKPESQKRDIGLRNFLRFVYVWSTDFTHTVPITILVHLNIGPFGKHFILKELYLPYNNKL